jgi:hypothetical protein
MIGDAGPPAGVASSSAVGAATPIASVIVGQNFLLSPAAQ